MAVDIVIIGTGPAGLSAGLLAGRYGHDTVLLERTDLGGELVNQHHLEYPGFPGITGPELREQLVEHLREYDVTAHAGEAHALHPGDPHRVRTTTGDYEAATVIIAGGARSRELECPGADTYRGHGVFDCAVCDGPLYAGEPVAVYGAGERAIGDSLYLADIATDVTVLVPDELSAPPSLVQQARDTPNITIRPQTRIIEVTGDDVLRIIRTEHTRTNARDDLAATGLLVRTGLVPNTDYLAGTLGLTPEGWIQVDQSLETSAPGVFAAGAIRADGSPRVAAAVGDGVTAFESAHRFLGHRNTP